MAEHSGDFQARLATLRRQYVEDLPNRLSLISAGLDGLLGDGDGAAAHELRRHVHGLSGSGATFGFSALSQTCRAMETLIAESAAHKEPVDLVALMAAWGAVRQAAQAVAAESARAAPAEAPLPPARGTAVWMVDPAGRLDEHAAQQLSQHGFDVRRFADADALLGHAQSHAGRDAVVVVDAGPVGADLDGIALAERLQDRVARPLPIVFISDEGDLATRIRAVRAGGVGWLKQPVATEPLIDLLERVSERGSRAPYRVLIVENDRAQADACAAGLRRDGFEARIVEAVDLLTSLETMAPDVLLMDLYLDGCLGSELAAVVRQDPRWVGLPIVFLSVEQDDTRQHRAIVRGGDAFLTKPLSSSRLAEVLSARAGRARVFRQQLLRDSLTGTLNHAALMAALTSEIAGALRRGTPLAFAMFDLDSFKAVNDRHGHAVGDRVLRAFSQLLKTRLRAGDTIGRYGGEEFGIVLPDISDAGAFALIDSLRMAFAEIEHASESGAFRVTVSAGIAACPHHTTAASVRDAADAALYRAKRGGRDRVELDAT
jgi:diguanylate cyclase (GGDEF)-like protein